MKRDRRKASVDAIVTAPRIEHAERVEEKADKRGIARGTSGAISEHRTARRATVTAPGWGTCQWPSHQSIRRKLSSRGKKKKVVHGHIERLRQREKRVESWVVTEEPSGRLSRVKRVVHPAMRDSNCHRGPSWMCIAGASS